MNFFDHKDLGNHLLQLCPKVVKHPVYVYIYIYIYIYIHTHTHTHTRHRFVLSIYLLTQKAVLKLHFLIAAIKVVKRTHTTFIFSHIFRCENQIFTYYLALA